MLWLCRRQERRYFLCPHRWLGLSRSLHGCTGSLAWVLSGADEREAHGGEVHAKPPAEFFKAEPALVPGDGLGELGGGHVVFGAHTQPVGVEDLMEALPRALEFAGEGSDRATLLVASVEREDLGKRPFGRRWRNPQASKRKPDGVGVDVQHVGDVLEGMPITSEFDGAGSLARGKHGDSPQLAVAKARDLHLQRPDSIGTRSVMFASQSRIGSRH